MEMRCDPRSTIGREGREHAPINAEAKLSTCKRREPYTDLQNLGRTTMMSERDMVCMWR